MARRRPSVPAPEAPHPGNEEAVRNEIIRTMGVVGIDRAYHSARLENFPPYGAELKKLILSTWTTDGIKEGRGITIDGSTEMSGHLHMMVARSLHLAGTRVLVAGLPGLVRILQQDDEDSDFDSVGALFIRKFSEGKECPLRPFEIGLVEEGLDQFLGRSRSLFPWMSDKVPPSPWWSVDLLERVENRNTSFEVRR